MDRDDFRFNISTEKYLERHDILSYIEDAVTQLLEHKEENPKVNTSRFFSDYFSSVKDGNHVIFREFAYVKATPHNRASFVRTFWKCFRHIGRKGDLLSVREYHSLICLLCPDFPFQPVQKTARIILMDDAMDCLISFSDFLFALQIQFCFEEFLIKCAEVYKSLLDCPQTSHVVVPTSEESPDVHLVNGTENKALSDPQQAQGDGIDSTLFFRALVPVCDKLDLRAPPIQALRDILNSAKRVTFYGFLMALAKSEELNKAIGKLPPKSELLDITDQELTSTLLRPSSGHPLSSSALPQLPGQVARPRSGAGGATDIKTHTEAQTGTKPAQRAARRVTGARKNPHSNSAINISRKNTSRKTAADSTGSDDDDDDDDDDDSSDGSGSTTN